MLSQVFRHLAHDRIIIPYLIAKDIHRNEKEVVTAVKKLLKKGFLEVVDGDLADRHDTFSACGYKRVWNQPELFYACTKKGRQLLETLE